MKNGIIYATGICLLLLTTSFTISFPENLCYNQIPGLGNAEIVNGLKQALEQGTDKSTNQLSMVDGFFANAAVKILLPPEAKKAENTLRKLGFGKLCDNAILSLNRAAESAALQAKPIFIDAIKQMSIKDALGILTGSKDAATQYFKKKPLTL